MTTLGINEKFTLSFLITKKEVETHGRILSKLVSNHNITQYDKAPAMWEVTFEVNGISGANDIINKLGESLAILEDINDNWNKGLLTRDEYTALLSKYMI